MNDSIARQLDAIHQTAQEAYQARNATAYMALFSPGVVYRQADGRVIGRKELARDVVTQFRRLSGATTKYERTGLRIKPDHVEEDLVQQAWAVATAFLFLHRVWKLERTGTYTWLEEEGQWRIAEVTVHQERLAHQAWRFGPKPALPSRAV